VGASGGGSDVVVCDLVVSGRNTECTFSSTLYWEALLHDFAGAIDGLSVTIR